MNFSFSLFLVSLSLRFVSCEKCSEALRETFKKAFDVGAKCDDCVILSPGISFRGENWSGFCTGNQLFLFRDWKCRTNNDLMNLTQAFAIVTNELCQLVRRNLYFVEKCLKAFNDEECDRQLDSANDQNLRKDQVVNFLHFTEAPMDLKVSEAFDRRFQPTRKTTTTGAEKTTIGTTTSPATVLPTIRTSEKETSRNPELQSSTPKTISSTTSTTPPTTRSTTTATTWSSPTPPTTMSTTTATTWSSPTPPTTRSTTTATTWSSPTPPTTRSTTTATTWSSPTPPTTGSTTTTTTWSSPTPPTTGSTTITTTWSSPTPPTTGSTTTTTTWSSPTPPTTSFPTITSPDFSSTTIYPSHTKKTCELKEEFFKDYCYFIKFYQQPKYDSDMQFKKTNGTRAEIALSSIDSKSSCQERHSKALGLAVETKEENHFVMDFLSRFHLYNKYFIFTSGVRIKGLPDEWYGWDLKVNQRVLNLGQVEWLKTGDTMYYSIHVCNRNWYLLSLRNSQPDVTNSLIICKRPYNPKNVKFELHEQCLKLYRNSSCYNPEKHVNFCCEKDETGEIWFACANETQTKYFPGSILCDWNCMGEGFFTKDRPTCKGKIMCDDSYNNITYTAAATRYAISGCPGFLGHWGHSIWYCSPNKTFLGTPDYSLCCDSRLRCRNTDIFLNVWMGCPRKRIVKKTSCPSGSVLDEALVEWYCQSDGTFRGNAPDYSNCNVSKIMCKKTDRFGTEWEAAAGTIKEKKCPSQFTGNCFWECKKSGKFDGPEPDCSRCRADWMDKIADKIKNQTNHEDVMETMENYTKNEDLTIGYSYILNLTADCVALFKNQTSEGKLVVFDKFLKSYSKILKNVAGNPSTWSSFSVPKRREYAEKIVETTQSAAFANLQSGNERRKYNETFARAEEDGFDFFVAYNPSSGSRFPLENVRESDWHLDISKINESHPDFAAVGLVTSYSLSSLMFPQGNNTEDLELNAPVVTFTVAASANGEIVLDPNVTVSLSFKHKNRTRSPETIVIKRRLHDGEKPSGVFKSTLCFYYRDSDWDTEGCYVTFTSKHRTNCTCKHLSTIALLMSIHKYEPNATLEVVSTVSSGITIISLILALLVFYFFDSVGNDRVLIGKNLCFCLLIGHSLLVTVFDKKFFNITDSFCTISAILLHYVFMAAFAWMFVEGYHLYRMLVVVFDSGIEYRLIYLLIGYGMPFIVVGLTQVVGLILKEQPYGQDEVCWLKSPTYIWAFVGPVVILTSINVCILIIAMKQAISSQRKTEKSNFATVMLWMKRWVSLSALLGVTWLFGLGYINYNEPLVYVFIFFNGLQGFFILLFRCILCEQYKTVFLKKLKSWFSKYKSKGHKINENVKFETHYFVISATKSLTETKDSGCDPGIDVLEDNKICRDESSKVKTNVEIKSKENSSGVDSDITPEMSEAYLRNRIIARKSSEKQSKSKWQPEPDDFPELSYHDIYQPN